MKGLETISLIIKAPDKSKINTSENLYFNLFDYH